MAELGYPITDIHPSPLVQVEGTVSMGDYDAQLTISRGRPPHTDRWVEWIKGKAIPLPDFATPRYWRPKHPDKWDAPLPPPVIVKEGRNWHQGQSFSAADAAREMEDWREVAKATSDIPDKEKLPWWRDATLVRYEPKGVVTPRMAEGRLMRAVALCGHGQDLTLKAHSFGKLLADIAAAGEQEKYATSDYVPRLQPLPQDGNDFEIAMSWFVALDPPEQRSPKRKRYALWDFNRKQLILIWRSLNIPVSFEEIGKRVEFDMTGEGARKVFKSAINQVVAYANGIVEMPASAQIAALRDRNLAAKRVA